MSPGLFPYKNGWDGPPPGYRVTLSAGVKFCHVNVSSGGNPPSRDRIRDTSNTCKNLFGGGFASILKVTIENHSTEQQEQQVVLKSINRQNTWFSSIFLVTCLETIQNNLEKVHLGWRDCKIACKGGLFFYPS